MVAIEKIKENIDNKKSFVLEAGAGSGKTYTLIQTLNYLIEKKGKDIKYNNQKIICITYTNVAKNEIIERLEHNPLVLVSTIHEFLWDCIKSFQKQLKSELCKLNEVRYDERILKQSTLTGSELLKFEINYIQRLQDRISNIEKVDYQDTGYRNFEKGTLHHDDVIEISKMMMENNSLLTTILAQKFPYILIDEYQDTSNDTIVSLIDYLLERNVNKIILGFYGDSHQKIYEGGVGNLERFYINESEKKLDLIKKEENYRCSKSIVSLLNKFRTNIQQVSMSEINGSTRFLKCTYLPPRSTKINKKGETEFDEKITEYEKRIVPQKDANYDEVITKLEKEGWMFGDKSPDKILILTNSKVAKKLEFENLYEAFNKRYGQNTKYYLLDRNHPLIIYFTGYIDKKTSQERDVGLEHLVDYWEAKNYNEVFRFLKRSSNLFDGHTLRHSHKEKISKLLNELSNIRKTKTFKEVFDFAIKHQILTKSKALNNFLENNNNYVDSDDIKNNERIKKDRELYESIMNISYIEVVNFFEHIKNNTVFSTKHGTKGAEFRNVLVILDDTYFKTDYNFQNFFNGTEEKPERFERTKNLFYVSCSRAKENLVVLALSEMDKNALNNIEKWFGKNNVKDIDDL